MRGPVLRVTPKDGLKPSASATQAGPSAKHVREDACVATPFGTLPSSHWWSAVEKLDIGRKRVFIDGQYHLVFQLTLALTTPISAQDADNAAKKKDSKDLVCLSAPIGGIWVIDSIEGKGRVLVVHSPVYKERATPDDNELAELDDVFQWQVRLNHRGGMAIAAKTTNNGTDSSSGSRLHVAFCKPLVFECRSTVFNISNVDTVALNFRADVLMESNIAAISSLPTRDTAEEFLRIYGVNDTTFELLRISEIVGEPVREIWYLPSPGPSNCPEDSDAAMSEMVFRIRMTAVFDVQMGLQEFPFDHQALEIPLTVRLVNYERVRLVVHPHSPSVFRYRSFQMLHVFSVPYKDAVLATTTTSDPAESSAGVVYPRVIFTVGLTRLARYHVTNVALPAVAVTYLSFLSLARQATGEPLDVGARLSITLTLLLTAVAYKLVVASSIPQVSYFTLLDKYVWLCFMMLLIVAVENAAYPRVMQWFVTDDVDGIMGREYIVGTAMVGTFTLVNVWWAMRVQWVMARRDCAVNDRAQQIQQDRDNAFAFQRQASNLV